MSDVTTKLIVVEAEEVVDAPFTVGTAVRTAADTPETSTRLTIALTRRAGLPLPVPQLVGFTLVTSRR